MSDNWSFREDEPFLEEDAKVIGEGEDHSYKAGWKTNITYNGNVVALIKLMRSGANCLVEL